MNYGKDKIDDPVLALLFLNIHDSQSRRVGRVPQKARQNGTPMETKDKMNIKAPRNDPNPICAVLLMALAILGSGLLMARVCAAPPNDSGAGSPAYPLKVSDNRRYLVDQNNIPFLIVGDVPQSMVGMITPADAASFLDDRQAHGFNAMWIDVLVAGPYYSESREDGGSYDGILPFTGYLSGGKDLAHYDLTQPNEAYFARVDQTLTLAANHGMVVFLDPIETGQWLPTLRNNGPAAARVYGQYLGNRYKGFDNIIWLNGNDFSSWNTPGDDAVVRGVAEGIKSVDSRHLQTSEMNVWTSSSYDDPTWVPIASINSTYTYSPTYLQMWHSYNQAPTAPTFLLEGEYDLVDNGKPVDYGTPSLLRRQEYWTMLSGGKGQLYGNGYTDLFMSGWKYYVDTVGVTQLMLWHGLFSSLPWQDLVPDQDHTVVTAGFGTPGDLQTRPSKSDFCTASKTPDGSYLIAYMPTAREITVNMGSLKGSASARWFDPTNGTYTIIPGGPFANAGTWHFTPPRTSHDDGASDWVLLLDASSSAP